MAHREFRGSDGRQWTAWSVHPEYAERRAAQTSAATSELGSSSKPSAPPTARGASSAPERRVRSEIRASLSGGFSHGWLVFESKDEKRRLAPYPDDWVDRSDEELSKLVADAKVVTRAKRRLVE
jgi:hypothetical protein